MQELMLGFVKGWVISVGVIACNNVMIETMLIIMKTYF